MKAPPVFHSDEVDRILGTNRDPPDAADSGRTRSSILRPIPLPRLGPSAPPDWLWSGFLARGYVTLLVGLMKAGKSTLVAHLLHDLEAGGTLIADVMDSPILVISEEATGHWLRRRDELGLGDRIHLQTHPFMGRPSVDGWLALIDEATALVRGEPRYGLVVFDTLPALWPVLDENNASEVGANLQPLRRLTAAGAAVLLTHHPRKGDGAEGRASRGSGALPGFVDIIAELRRMNPEDAHDRRRVLKCYGRFDETPPESVLELRDDGYHHVGDRATLRHEDRMEAIGALLPIAPPGWTADEMSESWTSIPKPCARLIRADLNAGFDRGRWRRDGTGRKGDPFRYWRPDSFPAPSQAKGKETHRADL